MSGGPIIRTSHLKMSLSSMSPAEKPSTGFLFNSGEEEQLHNEHGKICIAFVFSFKWKGKEGGALEGTRKRKSVGGT